MAAGNNNKYLHTHSFLSSSYLKADIHALDQIVQISERAVLNDGNCRSAKIEREEKKEREQILQQITLEKKYC